MMKKLVASTLIAVPAMALSATPAQAHNLALNAWFGGSLMGAIGVNSAESAITLQEPPTFAEASRLGNPLVNEVVIPLS